MRVRSVTVPPRQLAVIAAFVAALLVAPRAHGEDRPFVFAEDARTPGQLHVDAIYRVTWGIAPGGAVRPIGAAGLGLNGSMQELGAEVGLHDRISVRLYGLAEFGLPDNQANATLGAEARARLIGRNNGPVQVTLGVGVLREFGGDVALDGRVVASGTLGRLRVTADLLFEHSFRAHADAIDVIAMAGASVAVVNWFRVGAEYVGQDLEGQADMTELEGPKHMLGPTLSIAPTPRIQFVGGPAFGLTSTSPVAMVRLSVVGTL